ncbi:MAG: hypothetical protein AMJ41_04570 [candidate division Zixibacteria bacterium DG_27]|nr:MAG: hypothetical protein AMJ41_04570 [candidate division Zixibacteria bacterium DG_27]
MSDRHLTDEELQSYLDSDFTEDREWIQSHLQVCEHCREELVQYQQLYFGLSEDVGFELSPEFAESVISRIPEPAALARQRRFMSVFASISGAILGVAVLLYFTGLRPLLGFAEHIGHQIASFVISVSASFSELFSALNVNTHLLVYVAVVLALTLILDQIASYRKRPVFRIK